MRELCIVRSSSVAPVAGAPARAAVRSDPRPVRAVAGASLTPAPTAGSPRMTQRPSAERPVSGRVRALAAVVVGQPHDVVELGGADLKQLGPLERLVAMDAPGGHVAGVARPEDRLADIAALVLEIEPQATRHHVDRLVLRDVLLERQPLARL